MSPLLGVDIVTITPLGYFVHTTHIDYVIGDSVNLAYADDGDRLFLLSKDAHQLAQVKSAESGVLDPATLTEFDLSALGLRQPKGMSVDAIGKYLYILDGVGPRLLRVPLLAGSGIDATQAQAIDLAALGISEARGVAIHPLSGNIYVGNPTAHTLYEVTSSATLVKVYNLSGLTMVDQQSLLFAPSADLTDDPAQLHLFIADSNVPGQASTPAENGLPATSTAIATAPTATAISTAVPTDTPIATSPATSTPIATAPTVVVTPTTSTPIATAPTAVVTPTTSTPIATAPTVTATAVVTPTSATPSATATTAIPTATTNVTPTKTVATPIPGATTPPPTTPTATVTTPSPTKSTTPTAVSSTPTATATMATTMTATRVPATPTKASSTATPTGQVQAVYLPLIARAGGQDVFRFGRVLEVVLE